MKYYVNFTVKGKPQLGSDAWFVLDGRSTMDNMISDAKIRMDHLSKVKSYDGFNILRGESPSSAVVISVFS